MPRGPKGEKRPADALGNAVMIAKLATGEIDKITTNDGKNAAALEPAVQRPFWSGAAQIGCAPLRLDTRINLLRTS